MADDYVIRDLPIYKAALRNNWESVKQIFEDDETKLTAKLTYWHEPPLLLAVGTNQAHEFVEQLVERIVSTGQADKLWLTSDWGTGPLHLAAKVGNSKAFELLVPKKPEMVQVPNPSGHTPLKLAAWHGHKETLQYLLKVTEDKSLGDDPGPYRGVAGGDLITVTIAAGFYDVALDIVNKYPHIAMLKDRNGETALQALAAKPDAFLSGLKLGFWGRRIYSWIPVNTNCASAQEQAATSTSFLLKSLKQACYPLISGFWNVIQYFAPYVKHIRDVKVTHMQTDELVKLICSIVIKEVNHDIAWDILGTAVVKAVTYGIHELIEECILAYPGIVWYNAGGFSLFFAAIEHRHEKVYNLTYQMSGYKVYAITHFHKVEDNTALHVAAKLAPPHSLNTVTGAALQMQREIQWFKEVEKLIEPSYKEHLNKAKQTPRMLFTEEHKELLKQGQEWMKNASSSCTVVAALIITIAFAAAFTVPGGNNSDGSPLFLNDDIFMLFAISDAIALFSSSTSVLMFLGILTSRYAEEDFLYALPKRMTIGLISLFMSIAATMIAFSATLALVLHQRIKWIAIPLSLIACIPVSLFILLLYPLLVELVLSTYGPSIFHRQSDKWIH